MTRSVPRALWWLIDHFASGTAARVWRAYWRFELQVLYFQLLLLLWLGLALAGGWFAAHAAIAFVGLPYAMGWGIGVAVGILCFTLLRLVADRLRIMQITVGYAAFREYQTGDTWPRLRRFAHAQPSWFDHVIDAGARRLVTAARANAADELVLIGHSSGGIMASAVMVRALDLDPDLGRHGPRLVLLTLGSTMPGCALHPASAKLREAIRRIAIEPSLTWIDCQSSKDVINFREFDPVEGIGVRVGAMRCNPMTWLLFPRKMMSAQAYRRLQRSIFLLHYQFLLSSDRRAAFDYVMLVGGPAPVAEWARRRDELLAEFSEDGTFVGDHALGGHAGLGAMVPGEARAGVSREPPPAQFRRAQA